MRAKLIVAAVAALAVAAVGATQVPGKAPSKPPLNFTLNGKIETVSFVDNAPDGDSVGDVSGLHADAAEPGRQGGRERPRDLHQDPAGGAPRVLRRLPPGARPAHDPGHRPARQRVRGEIDVRHLSPIEERFVFQLKR